MTSLALEMNEEPHARMLEGQPWGERDKRDKRMAFALKPTFGTCRCARAHGWDLVLTRSLAAKERVSMCLARDYQDSLYAASKLQWLRGDWRGLQNVLIFCRQQEPALYRL